MAKKKRKRHRNPVAPPVHSAPEAVQRPQTFEGQDAPPARPVGAEPPAGEQMQQAAPSVKGPRPRPASRPSKRRRPGTRSRLRTYMWIALVIVVIVGAFVARSIINGREVRAFNSLATANGCGNLQTSSDSGENDHLPPGQTTEYDNSPPTHGAHDGTGTVPAGVYDESLSDNPGVEDSIYRAVHSLEHGAVIIWHNDLEDDELEDLEREYQNETKVIIVPYPELEGDTKVALTSWARMVECEGPSTRVIDRYIEMFRSQRPAPEPNNAI